MTTLNGHRASSGHRERRGHYNDALRALAVADGHAVRRTRLVPKWGRIALFAGAICLVCLVALVETSRPLTSCLLMIDLAALVVSYPRPPEPSGR